MSAPSDPGAARPSTPAPFWTVPVVDALSAADSTLGGLTSRAAEARLKRDGLNATLPPQQKSALRKVVKRLSEPLLAILLAAAFVSMLGGDAVSAVIIIVMVVVSVTLDVVQEHRAEHAVEALRTTVAIRTRVLRDGAALAIPVETLVRGDVVLLEAGDLVPADGVAIECGGALVNEALLTGEPYPVEKQIEPSQSQLPHEARNALFGGSTVVSGAAKMLVLETGRRTRFGGIAAAMSAEEPPTTFEKGLHALGVLIVRLTVFLVLFVLLAHLAFHRPPLQSFLFAVALAVGLTPELLPMVTTVTLSRGAVRMAARKVIVKRLAAIHDLGAMDVLCTDKTGTLTQGRMAFLQSLAPTGGESARPLQLARLNSALSRMTGNPIDTALQAAPPANDLTGSKIAEAPFDFVRRRASVLVETDGSRMIVTKGAPEELLGVCTAIDMENGAAAPITADVAQAVLAIHTAEATKGLRLIGVAYRRAPPGQDALSPADERDMTFAGFCTFADPPKPSAAAAIVRLRSLGVRVKILSGDAAAVVTHLVTTLNIPAEGLLTGADIDAMSDEILADRVGGVDLFARIAPEQKARIINALKKRGHAVGFLGDGVNDAPAIHAADCGLSVDGASDVARAAADMILLAPDLSVLADGVAEGRRTYANITKYVRMGTSSNFGNMLSMALASIAIPFLPLTAVQILLNNLLYDISETGIPFDSVDDDEVSGPHTWDMAAVLRFTLVMGSLSSAFDIATFALLANGFHASPETFRTAWFLESLATQILVIFLIRTRSLPWVSRPHPLLIATSLGTLLVGVLIATGPFARVLGFAPLSLSVYATIVAIVLAYLTCAEALKRVAMSPSRARHG